MAVAQRRQAERLEAIPIQRPPAAHSRVVTGATRAELLLHAVHTEDVAALRRQHAATAVAVDGLRDVWKARARAPVLMQRHRFHSRYDI